MPLIIPVLVLVISTYLVIAPIIENPQLEYVYAVLFIFAGLILYVPFVHYGYQVRFMSEYCAGLLSGTTPKTLSLFPFADKVTIFFQMLLEVVPTTSTMALFD